MQAKVAIINAYFGKLPSWFQLWLNSCEYNKEFNWIIYTDDETEYKYPVNVKRKFCSLEDIKIKISEKLKIKSNIENAYKLCDFKVVYGIIFEEDLKDYTHWGYCDLDVIFGDLSKFINDDILDKYDRVYNKGHLTIYKNNKNVNEYYKLEYDGPNYKEIFKSKYHYGFDEIAGLDKIYKKYNLKQYISKNIQVADIAFSKHKFEVNKSCNYKNQYFMWDKGRIYRKYYIENIEREDEFAYIHFQKRQMILKGKIYDKYVISPIGIIDYKGDEEAYRSNMSNIKFETIKKIKYYMIILKQKRFRFLHWKLKI